MRVAVTAARPQLDAPVDPRFGRCPVFLIVETDTLGFEALDNGNQNAGQGAGILAAQLMAQRGVKYVLTGNCGPNAHEALRAAGIGVVVGCSGTVRQAVEQFAAGQLQQAAGPNVPGHSGMARGAPAPGSGSMPGATVPAGSPSTAWPGRGMGMGGGGGMGRGMGRGCGQGGGRGRGRGCGGS
jgi:predicted Fe-Mo cluster-binding NifX family protein